jgi:hypothetical protein
MAPLREAHLNSITPQSGTTPRKLAAVDLMLFGVGLSLLLLTLPAALGMSADGIARIGLFLAIVGIPAAVLVFAQRRHGAGVQSSPRS